MKLKDVSFNENILSVAGLKQEFKYVLRMYFLPLTFVSRFFRTASRLAREHYSVKDPHNGRLS